MFVTATVKVTSSSSYRGIPHPGGGRTPLMFEKGEEIEVLSDEGDWWQVRYYNLLMLSDEGDWWQVRYYNLLMLSDEGDWWHVRYYNQLMHISANFHRLTISCSF